MSQDTAHAAQYTERAHWQTGARFPRTPHTRAHEGPTRDREEPTPHGSDTLGRPSRSTGPAAGVVPKAAGRSAVRLHRGPWQTSPGAMEATGDGQAGTQSQAERPRNLNHKGEAVVP